MSGFRTSLVHSCFSIDLFEPQPKTCKCRKLVSRDKAVEMVKRGEADWLIDYRGEVPIPTWNIAYRGRGKKTPRAKVTGRAEIERALERRDILADKLWLADEGKFARDMEDFILGAKEHMERWDMEYEILNIGRIELFGHIGNPSRELLELKKFSDTFGTVEGAEGKYVTEIITSRADEIKNAAAVDDPYEGRTLFPMIGFSQQTNKK